jgi:hypothetical protein
MNRTALLLAIGLVGCSTHYAPQSRGRVAMVMRGGAPAYVRDGLVYEHGFLGSGLERAVAGNPSAQAAAHQYHARLRDGLLISIGGLVCSTVAVTYAVRELDRNGGEEAPTALWVSLGCLVASLAGTGYMASAEPYRWDAINIFNDTEQQLPSPYSPPGLGAKAQASLRMRDP